eukprot:NODE_8456_length_517_cov_4.040598_g7395_i0.p4 GENE.NODE_8456_length_517_cov_4.040598_g7395_i0~~NODE_8456_length_517_cov_4.040598_g7395_i0.p4  ORF type:complete len:50 (-),score=2.78 NODE_8456_length_517_cov_4.040598_g7395_i0:284-433(-)
MLDNLPNICVKNGRGNGHGSAEQTHGHYLYHFWDGRCPTPPQTCNQDPA